MGRATSKGNDVKDETPLRYAHAEIRTQVVVVQRAAAKPKRRHKYIIECRETSLNRTLLYNLNFDHVVSFSSFVGDK